MSNKRDFFEADQPVHKLSYCAFLDVLGFSERIRASYKDKNSNNLLQQFHEILDNSTKEMKKQADDSLIYFKSFTDNIILAHPRFSEDMESEFAFILWSISSYQLQMALRGFFIRGGLSIGPLFMDENCVYGEALISAYELESKGAVNPIVVLSNEVMNLVDQHIKYYSEESPQARDLLINSDGRYFVNYLSECILDSDYETVLDVESLEKHKDQIQQALHKYAQQPAVFSKFSWIATYHNHFCNSVSKISGYKPSLKIPKQRATVKFRKLSRK